MKLEIGKYYRTRNGRKSGDVMHGYMSSWPMMANFDGTDIHYDIDGKVGGRSDEHPLDLIAEWTDEPQSKLCNSLTDEQKEAALREPTETGTLAELNVKPGDVVECVSNERAWGQLTVGDKYVIGDGRCPIDDMGRQFHWTKATFRIVPDQPSPVRTVTRKEIVPGVYGKVNVGKWVGDYKVVPIMISQKWSVIGKGDEESHALLTRDDLTAAIETLTAIKEAME